MSEISLMKVVAQRLGRAFRPTPPRRRLTVASATSPTPNTRRLVFEGADLSDLVWRPGQDLVLHIPLGAGDTAPRHYTIRDFDDGLRRLVIDFVLHGHGPGAAWASRARVGDVLEAVGPRGRTGLTEGAERRLFIGDETALPVFLAMAEALPDDAPVTALVSVAGQEEIQTTHRGASIAFRWLYRGDVAGNPADALLAALQALAPRPEGVHAYVLGETALVRAARQELLLLGFDRGQITAEGYWRPGRVGGHDHV